MERRRPPGGGEGLAPQGAVDPQPVRGLEEDHLGAERVRARSSRHWSRRSRRHRSRRRRRRASGPAPAGRRSCRWPRRAASTQASPERSTITSSRVGSPTTRCGGAANRRRSQVAASAGCGSPVTGASEAEASRSASSSSAGDGSDGLADRRQQVRPERVQHALHVGGVRRRGDHGVVLGQDHAELPVRAVAAVAVPRHPELEAVALAPVRVRLVRVGHLAPGRLIDPRVAEQPPAVPDAALQVEQAELGDGVGGGVQTAEAEVRGRAGTPARRTRSMPSGSNSRGRR